MFRWNSKATAQKSTLIEQDAAHGRSALALAMHSRCLSSIDARSCSATGPRTWSIDVNRRGSGGADPRQSH